MAAEFKTLLEAIQYFADPNHCLDYMVSRRWPNGVECPTCGSKDVRFLANQRRWECKAKHAKKQFSAKVGTIFEDSPIPLEKWLPAVWLLSSNRNGISSWELHRALGVTQKTAWFMLQRIRLAMQDENFGGKLGGEVEIDETYIGGKARNMHKDRRERALGGKGGGVVGKVGVQGILERGGKIKTAVIRDSKRGTLVPNINKNVEAGTHVFTDELQAYFRSEYKAFLSVVARSRRPSSAIRSAVLWFPTSTRMSKPVPTCSPTNYKPTSDRSTRHS